MSATVTSIPTADTAASDAAAPRPKKSVALSGVTAGDTALCTVGRTLQLGTTIEYHQA